MLGQRDHTSQRISSDFCPVHSLSPHCHLHHHGHYHHLYHHHHFYHNDFWVSNTSRLLDIFEVHYKKIKNGHLKYLFSVVLLNIKWSYAKYLPLCLALLPLWIILTICWAFIRLRHSHSIEPSHQPQWTINTVSHFKGGNSERSMSLAQGY